MTDTVFYAMSLQPEEEGLAVVTTRFYSIHETRCFHYCLPETSHHILNCLAKPDSNETILRFAKRKGYKVRRIAKDGSSRIAFKSEEQALANLKYRKKLQIRHMEREMAFLSRFVSENPSLADLVKEPNFTHTRFIRDTKDLVNEYLFFY